MVSVLVYKETAAPKSLSEILAVPHPVAAVYDINSGDTLSEVQFRDLRISTLQYVILVNRATWSRTN